MLIENKWFALQAPIRADLSGRPFGFLFVWLGGVGRLESGDRFRPYSRAQTFGFYVPYSWFDKLFKRRKVLECAMLTDVTDDIPGDWRRWPGQHRAACEAAVQMALAETPGCTVIRDKSACDRRVDLSGRPLQLYRSITLRLA